MAVFIVTSIRRAPNTKISNKIGISLEVYALSASGTPGAKVGTKIPEKNINPEYSDRYPVYGVRN